MPTPSLDAAGFHATVFGALRGVLGKSARRPGQEVCAQALWTLDALAPKVTGGLDPLRPVKAGYPIGAALLLADAHGFNAPFFDAWADRYGLASLFPEHQAPVPQVWLEALSKQLELDCTTSAQVMAGPVAWILDRAPSGQLPSDLLDRLALALETQRNKSGMAPAFSGLLDRLASRLSPDPRRPMARWLTQQALAAQDLDPDQPVCAPSGRERSLGELVRLAHPDREQAGTSPGALPELPHRRLKELCRQYVLDERVPVETARARLWASLIEKPEVLDTLLDWHAGNGGQPGDPDRIAAIMKARDPLGRGLLAFLATHPARDPSTRSDQVKAILGAGLLAPSDVYDRQGAGLIEQSLAAMRQNLRADPFEHPSFPAWIGTVLDPDAVVGPADRLPDLVADLVDGMIPGGYAKTQARVLHDLRPQPALAQAFAWLKVAHAGQRANPVWTGTSGAARRRRDQAIDAARLELGVGLQELASLVGQEPGALAVGAAELRQWQAGALASAAKQPEFAKHLPSLERALHAVDMMRALPAATGSAPRPRM